MKRNWKIENRCVWLIVDVSKERRGLFDFQVELQRLIRTHGYRNIASVARWIDVPMISCLMEYSGRICYAIFTQAVARSICVCQFADRGGICVSAATVNDCAYFCIVGGVAANRYCWRCAYKRLSASVLFGREPIGDLEIRYVLIYRKA